jgi:hypothetical protein
MKFVIESDRCRTESQNLSKNYSAVVFGFPSEIEGLNIVFENPRGEIARHDIPDTTIGFAIDNISSYSKVWFEYEKADKNYSFELVTE